LIYLILDTNHWIYLANGLDPLTNKHYDHLHYDLLKSLKELKDKEQAQVIINEIIITEWHRNKEHCKAKVKKLQQKLTTADSAFTEIGKYTTANVRQLEEEFIQNLQEEIRVNEAHIQHVEDFLINDCVKVDISQALKLRIFDLSITNQAPFHNKKNNVGDAAILLSAVDYLKTRQDYFGYQAFFISNNIAEYTDGKNPNAFHPQLTPLLSDVNIRFERVLPAALNISQQIIADMEQFLVKLAEHAVEAFTWDLTVRESGVLMCLDVRYHNKFNQRDDFLTLCVAKDKDEQRPKGMSFILPSSLRKEQGLFLFFTAHPSDHSRFTIEPVEQATIRLPFESEADDTVTARVWGGYGKNEETGIVTDVLASFLEFDHVFVMYFNPDSSPQTISVPLFSFRQQYALLPL
jgi:hypothetical protein